MRMNILAMYAALVYSGALHTVPSTARCIVKKKKGEKKPAGKIFFL